MDSNDFRKHYGMKPDSRYIHNNFGDHSNLGSSSRTNLQHANFEKTRDTIELFSSEISNFDAQCPNLLENTYNLEQVNESQFPTDFSGTTTPSFYSISHTPGEKEEPMLFEVLNNNLGQFSRSQRQKNFQISSRHAANFLDTFPYNYEQLLPTLHFYTDHERLFGNPHFIFMGQRERDAYVQSPCVLFGKSPHPTDFSFISLEQEGHNSYDKVPSSPDAFFEKSQIQQPMDLFGSTILHSISVEQNKQNTYKKISGTLKNRKERHKCNICGKSFTGPCALRIHGVSHTKEKLNQHTQYTLASDGFLTITHKTQKNTVAAQDLP
ncbi:4758_t:CDS:2 [Acaulospora morrowiae]|uniref:4758_t:CDS:1 n=1 Tax=Acaulospora morrowiae TaxID=94023 RepID=A0A9N8YS77_9GLOM|nr:4758_t:CDS:2 [Acaulospora morrowiae]